jgi:competence protein ComEC
VKLLNYALGAIAALPFASIDGLHPSILQVVLIYVLVVLFYLFARRLFPIIGSNSK